MDALLLCACLLGLLAIGIPVGFSLWISGLFGVFILGISSPLQVAQSLYSGIDNYILLAIPFFILVGNIMVRGGVSGPVFAMMRSLTTRVNGGPAVGTAIACAAFGSMTGSSIASAAALGRMSMEELSSQGYPRPFVGGLLAAGGTLGLIIPPSVVLVVFAAFAKVSVADVFIAAILPGIITATALVVVTYIVVKRRGYGEVQVGGHPTGRKILRDVLEAAPAFAVPVIILGGIFLGYVTPTESAVVASIYVTILTVFIWRRIRIVDFFDILRESAMSTASILFIVSGAVFFGFLATVLGIPNAILNLISDLNLTWWQFLLLFNIFIIILGCFLDGFTILTVLAPMVVPAVREVGIDLHHFAIVLTLNIEIAAVTPPLGLNLFVLSSITGVPISDIVRGVLPYTVMLIAVLAAVSFIPFLSLAFI